MELSVCPLCKQIIEYDLQRNEFVSQRENDSTITIKYTAVKNHTCAKI